MQKHWSENVGWEIAKAIHHIVFFITKKVISATRFLVMSCNEVMIVDNQSRVSIQAYLAHGGSNP
jgi:hypothetical protein